MIVLIPWIVVGIETIVTWFVLYGARKGWLYFTSAIARVFQKHHFNWRNLVLPAIGIGSVQVNTAVQHATDDLGKGAKEGDPHTSGWVIGMAAALEYHAFTLKYLAADTLHAIQAIGSVAIPHGAKTQTANARAQAAAAARQARAAARAAAKAQAAAARAARTGSAADVRAAQAAAAAAQAAGAVAVPAPWELPRIRTKEQADAVSRWFARWRKLIIAGLGAAAFTGVVLRVLTRHLPWFRCANVNKTMRQLCRTPTRWLDDVLTLFADFFILTNICRVIPWLESGFAEVAGPLISTLARAGAGVCNAGYASGPTLDTPTLYLPETSGGSLFIA